MITQYLKDSAENMWQAFNGLSSYISHPGVKGESRENIVIEFLEKFLPKKYSITSGIIISAEGGQSKQQDIIIYDALTSPVICTDQYSLIPVESVYATIEVKSKFTKDELSKSVNNIRSVKELKHNSVRETSLHRRMSTPAGFVFAYTAESDIDNYIKQLDNLNSDICVSNRLNALTILDRGSIFNVNKQNILEIISFPSEETSLGYNGAIGEKGDNLMFFYLLLITTLNSIEINPPNMTIYAAKSKIHSYRPGVTIPSELLRHDMNIQLPDIGNVPLGEIPKLSKYTKEFFSIIQNSDETRKAILNEYPHALTPSFAYSAPPVAA